MSATARNPGIAEFSGVFRLPEMEAAAGGDFLKKNKLQGHFLPIFLVLL
jgi:hypothetical protein